MSGFLTNPANKLPSSNNPLAALKIPPSPKNRPLKKPVGSLPNNFAMPGPPNLSAAAPNATLPNGDLTTFFTAFLAYLTILPRK